MKYFQSFNAVSLGEDASVYPYRLYEYDPWKCMDLFYHPIYLCIIGSSRSVLASWTMFSKILHGVISFGCILSLYW